MTQFPSDQLAKDYLRDFLEPLGTVQRNFEVPGQAKYVDIWFCPHADGIQTQDLGVLGRIVATPCLLEPFRNAPTREEIDGCIGKRYSVLDEQRRRAKQEDRKLTDAEQARLWILGTTVYQPIIEEYTGRLDSEWGEGVYFLSDHLKSVLVAINKLPVTPDTLWLRLLGRGRTQQAAIEELLALPADDNRRSQALQLLVNWRIRLELTNPQDAEEQELMATLSQAYLDWEQRTEQRGELRGEQRERDLIMRQFAHRFGDLPASLRTRTEQLSLDRLEELSLAWLDFDSIADLQNWLAEH